MPKKHILFIKAYDPVIMAWLSKIGSRPSLSYLSSLDKMIRQMRLDGNLTELDYFLFATTESQSHAQVPLISTSGSNITEVNSPTWTALRGYTGNGVDMHIRSNWNPSTNGVKYTQNSSSIHIYGRTNLQENSTDFGCYDGTRLVQIRPWTTSANNGFFSCNDIGYSYSILATNGFISNIRSASTTTNLYRNGTNLTTSAVASGTIPNLNMYILARNSSGVADAFSSRQISMVAVGSGSVNHATFRTAFQTFATEIGFNV